MFEKQPNNAMSCGVNSFAEIPELVRESHYTATNVGRSAGCLVWSGLSVSAGPVRDRPQADEKFETFSIFTTPITRFVRHLNSAAPGQGVLQGFWARKEYAVSAVYISKSLIVRRRGPLYVAQLPGERQEVVFSVHGAIAEHYKVDPAMLTESHFFHDRLRHSCNGGLNDGDVWRCAGSAPRGCQ